MPGQDVAPTYNKYRPPPGFAQDEQTSGAWSELDKKLKAMDANQLLDMVSSKAGYWHTIGKVGPSSVCLLGHHPSIFCSATHCDVPNQRCSDASCNHPPQAIPILNRQGFDSKLLEDITGIDSRTQNEWMMSAAVYDSLAMSGQFTEQEVQASLCGISAPKSPPVMCRKPLAPR